MANEVYRRSHEALATLVSPRVAHAVLEEALRTATETPDAVTVQVMRRLLAGPVRRELGSILPKTVVTRQLKSLAESLLELNESAPAAPAPVANALIAEAEAERALETLTSERLTAAELSTDPGPQSAAPAFSSTGLLGEAVSAFVPEPESGRLAGRAPLAPQPKRRSRRKVAPAWRTIEKLSAEAQTVAIKLFGDIETVTQVVILRGGEIMTQRGGGVDAKRLPSLVLSSRHLLARTSEFRALSVERSGGMLFLFPFGEDSVIVVTQRNVNIGAVLNARAALEEAA